MMYFFFFKQKTAYEMRISDWSSDVCSSDLPSSSEEGFGVVDAGEGHHPAATRPGFAGPSLAASPLKGRELADPDPIRLEIFNSLFMAIAEERSEERRVGKECVSTCRSRWSPSH